LRGEKFSEARNLAEFIAHSREDIPFLLAKIDRLQAIADKLPKYADTHEPIILGPHAEVWLVGEHWMVPDHDGYFGFGDGPHRALVVSWWGDHACVLVGEADDCDYWDGPMYSTPEAAEAARKAQEGGR